MIAFDQSGVRTILMMRTQWPAECRHVRGNGIDTLPARPTVIANGTTRLRLGRDRDRATALRAPVHAQPAMRDLFRATYPRTATHRKVRRAGHVSLRFSRPYAGL